LKRKKIFKNIQKFRKLKTPFSLFSVLLIVCLTLECTKLSNNLPSSNSDDSVNPPNTSLTFESGYKLFANETIMDDIIITFDANVEIINSTVIGRIYVFNMGNLQISQNSNITYNIVISDTSTLYLYNSTVGGTIECRNMAFMGLYNSRTLTTTIWKFDSANLIIANSSVGYLNEFGIAGSIQITDSKITSVILSGISTSLTYINNSEILSLTDLAIPSNVITGPVRFSFLTFNVSFSTSERFINLTWIGWDSPIIDGYLNITFQILVDSQIYAEIDGSGFYDYYSGNYQIQLSTPGFHNITIVSIDSQGNRYSSSIKIELIEYPSFPWIPFFIVIAAIISIIIILIVVMKRRQDRRYFTSLGTIVKKELAESKKKLLILTIIAAAPGIIVVLFFGLISRLIGGSISIDSLRDMVSLFFNLFIYYFGMAFSIIVGAGSVINAKKNGTLSWFFSKPVRRWEFLWGKIFAFIIFVTITMISSSLSFTLGCIFYVDPIYITDILSMGGYLFLIGILALFPLTAIVVFCSSVFKKTGLAYFVPIMILVALPPIISFLPMVARNEWPLLFSFTFYIEELGKAWVSTSGGLFGSLGSVGEAFGLTITPLNLNVTSIILILIGITGIFLVSATFLFRKQDLP
jgi:ABC-type transport system involved in multi-copper enzyme maturation permease subunit